MPDDDPNDFVNAGVLGVWGVLRAAWAIVLGALASGFQSMRNVSSVGVSTRNPLWTSLSRLYLIACDISYIGRPGIKGGIVNSKLDSPRAAANLMRLEILPYISLYVS